MGGVCPHQNPSMFSLALKAIIGVIRAGNTGFVAAKDRPVWLTEEA